MNSKAAFNLSVKSYGLSYTLTALDIKTLTRIKRIERTGIDVKHLSADFSCGFFVCSTSIRSIDDKKRWLFCKTLNLAIFFGEREQLKKAPEKNENWSIKNFWMSHKSTQITMKWDWTVKTLLFLPSTPFYIFVILLALLKFFLLNTCVK